MRLAAIMLAAGFFALLIVVRLADVYQSHFFDHGALLPLYQLCRILYLPYLVWLQYTVGWYALYLLNGRSFAFSGLPHFIASFLIGASLWHMILLLVGLAGGYHYPIMLLLAGGVMIASVPHLANVCSTIFLKTPIPLLRGGVADAAIQLKEDGSPRGVYPVLRHEARDDKEGVLGSFTGAEKLLLIMVTIAALAFLFLKGTYPSGAHDFFNHYFPYYKSVVQTGNLGPHESWIHYHYSKGLGLYFLSMILMDPFAVHLVGASFTLLAACIVFDMLRGPNASRLLPLWGVFLYLILYIYTPGEGLFALNGGWGDLEKTHEPASVLMLGCLWLVHRAIHSPHRAYVAALGATCAALVIVAFANGVMMGVFFAVFFAYALLRRNCTELLIAFVGGASIGASLLSIMLVNYLATGLPQDQLITYVWNWIDWKKVVSLGYTLELYAQMNSHLAHAKGQLPLAEALPDIVIHYFRLYLLWPLLMVGALFAVMNRRISGEKILWLFLLASFIFALFMGGRSQSTSYFRFSSFNYAPMLLACLLLWRAANLEQQRCAIMLCAVLFIPFSYLSTPYLFQNWYKLARSAYAFNTGAYSLRDAIGDMRGRVGRIRGGGIYPPMEDIYAGLPAGTRVWSLHNHSYCLLPDCNMQMYFSQITSKRWYDIATGSVEEGKAIMQEEGLNFIFYSRSVPVIGAADAEDMLAGFYKGLSPDHIGDVYGILWTNGWDYLLTWKEQSVAPLDANFMESWRMYQQQFVAPRFAKFPVDKLAPMVKKAIDDPAITRHPRPDWLN